ncbi:hypothetical protein A9F13_20g00341 [Clavispora lusitaniae]|uniref:Uncharacterized protein n=1 Tax=Clavispora lusitaniae TaxID=36911 RepID=A0AA91PWH1_CLALS|nr:hypothetical protein A9F13_20g00341 [Clavispora lusitaniae]
MTPETPEAVIFSTARLLRPVTQVIIDPYTKLEKSTTKVFPTHEQRNNVPTISSELNSSIGG